MNMLVSWLAVYGLGTEISLKSIASDPILS